MLALAPPELLSYLLDVASSPDMGAAPPTAPEGAGRFWLVATGSVVDHVWLGLYIRSTGSGISAVHAAKIKINPATKPNNQMLLRPKILFIIFISQDCRFSVLPVLCRLLT